MMLCLSVKAASKTDCCFVRPNIKKLRSQIVSEGCQRKQPAAHPSDFDTQPTTVESTKEGVPPSPLDTVELIRWGGKIPSRRRLIQGTLFAAAIALGGNFLGITSFLLGLDGGSLASKLKADVVVPVKGLKRCADFKNGFEFQFPASWLADQRIAQRTAARIEAENPLDPPPVQGQKRRAPAEPIVAFGPAGTNGEENVSVIVAPINGNFRLNDLGNPSEAGEQLLDQLIAPEGSGKVATLVFADSRVDDDNRLYYTLEYTVRTNSWFRHNLSVYAVGNGLLYTLNGQCPEEKWRDDEASLRRAAASFRLM